MSNYTSSINLYKDFNYKELVGNIQSNNDFYLKSILRYKKDKKIFVLDFHSGYSNFFNHNKYNKKNINRNGKSFLLRKKIFKHKNFADLQINTFKSRENIKPSFSLVKELFHSFELLKDRKIGNSIQLLKTIKGGFTGLSYGLFGFIPRSQFLEIFQRPVNKILKKDILSNKLYFSNLHEINKYLKPRAIFQVDNLRVLEFNEKTTYNIQALEKNNPLNLVFVSQKHYSNTIKKEERKKEREKEKKTKKRKKLSVKFQNSLNIFT